MSKRDTKDLKRFLKPFPLEKQKLALSLRDFVWTLYPKANELIYDNYNALAFGWSPSDKAGQVFCSIAVGRSSFNVHFGFYWGSKIADPRKLLIGQGNQYRYMVVDNIQEFPKNYMKTLIRDAYAYSLSLLKGAKPSMQGATIVKSISAVKRKPAKRLMPKAGE